jgi:FkbM family methyltransferase
MELYSQFGQDRVILRHFYGDDWETPPREERYFVEVGAHDGKEYSNTLAMEELGWSGICIEPNPIVLDDLKSNRNCVIDESCVYSENGVEVEFLASSAASSGINNDETVAMIKKNFGKNKKKGRKTTVVQKKTKTLTTILDYYDAPSVIDYLSVDVEGQEVHVINGIDFDKYKFRILSVEINNHDIDELVQSKGYKFLTRKRVDRIYACEELL